MRIIFLIVIGLSIGYADFSRDGDIVTDLVTRLEWQDDARVDQMKWREAINHCESLELDGNTDWRLPNINELKTIMDRSKPYLAASTFKNSSKNTSLYFCWTSTTVEGNYEDAWYINLGFEHLRYDNKGSNLYVRCVRGGR